MRRGESRQLKERAGYHDLMADLKKPGCPACRGADRSAWRVLDSILWESVNDPDTRRRLRVSRGFCREHALMVLAVASEQSAASGIAILYEDFLRHVRDEVIKIAKQSGKGASRRRRPGIGRAGRRCIACEAAHQTATNYLSILSEADRESEPGRAVREPTRGLCLPHLATGLHLLPSGQARQRLVDVYLRGEEALRADLTEFIRKQDYRFRGEGFTREQADSWVRAVHRLIGESPPRKAPRR